MFLRLIIFYILIFFANNVYAQSLIGNVSSKSVDIAYANIVVTKSNDSFGSSTDDNGVFKIDDLSVGKWKITITAIGFEKLDSIIYVNSGVNEVNFILNDLIYVIDQIVVTGTKTFKRKTESAVIVNVIDDLALSNVQACNLADGLNFQSGLRLEVDCQTCNYTQLRMNGLSGSYSQILINGRPVFSPLTSLYGLEQIPVNMIDRLEIVKGGGSALYGSSAIGGVVNVITRLPKKNSYNFGYNYNNINNVSNDLVFFGNFSVVSKNGKSGVSFFANQRDRNWYDHNDDNFSELPLIKSRSFGMNLFLLPSNNHKIEINLGSISSYRFGGEMVEVVPHFALQAEERNHDILIANIDYKINLKNNSSLVSYLSLQKTNRDHYTGVRPQLGSYDDIYHLQNPPYGKSESKTSLIGIQYDRTLNNFAGKNTISIGSELSRDDVFDKISAYNYLIDDNTYNSSFFIQTDWLLSDDLNLLSGFRLDKNSIIDNIIFSPRASLLYDMNKNTQIRCSYASGFRAPQAFDTDLHLAFANGGVSRIFLDSDLTEERSNSYTFSINHDKPSYNYIYGFTLEMFYTELMDVFYQEYSGFDEFGQIFTKKNGSGAIVYGFHIESRLNIAQKFQFESGFTIQESNYNSAVLHSENLSPIRKFLRTPSKYGYFTMYYFFSDVFKLSVNTVYTGSMELVHFAGAPGVVYDKYVSTKDFYNTGVRISYTKELSRLGFSVESNIGVKNLFNAYQSDFDMFENRDSNFVYGPANPRVFYLEFVFNSLL